MNDKNKATWPEKIQWIEVFDRLIITETAISDILRMLQWLGCYKDTSRIQLTEEYGAYLVDDIFIVESSSYEKLESIKNVWIKNFKKKNPLTSEMIDGREVPEYSGYFQKDGKYYLLGALYYSKDKRNLEDKEGAYSGVLWNPVWYQENNPTFKQVQASVTNAWKILDWE